LGVGWSFKHNIIQWADKGNRWKRDYRESSANI
jgi:hypothetical protein